MPDEQITIIPAGASNPDAWRLDGHDIVRGGLLGIFRDLDWSRAWRDDGPSVAGNPGPYWHVPRRSNELVHRLYPRT